MQPSVSCSNDLHDALLCKNGTAFWKCWRSRFETASKCVEVEQYCDPNNIATKFACHFSKAYKANNEQQAEVLRQEYVKKRVDYCACSR